MPFQGFEGASLVGFGVTSMIRFTHKQNVFQTSDTQLNVKARNRKNKRILKITM